MLIIDMKQAMRGSKLIALGLTDGFRLEPPDTAAPTATHAATPTATHAATPAAMPTTTHAATPAATPAATHGHAGHLAASATPPACSGALFSRDERQLLDRLAKQGQRVVVLLDEDPLQRQRASGESASVDYLWISPKYLDVPGFAAARGEALARLCHRRGMRMGDVAYIATSPLDREVAMGAGRVLALADAGDAVRRLADMVLPARAAGGLVAALLRARAFNPRSRDQS